MHLKKRMRTVVITGGSVRKIKYGVGFLAICTLMGLAAFTVTLLPKPDTAASISILSRGVNDNRDDEKIGVKILGFDISDAKTIFFKYYAQFGEVEKVVEAVESAAPEPIAKETAKVYEGYDIKAVNVAKGMALSNLSGLSVDTEKLLSEPLHITLDDAGPQVLIVHTHTTESFTDAGKTKYTAEDRDRSTDNSKNMVAVGEVMKNVLEGAGIKTIHDTTVHDYPSYNGAYTRSMTTVRNNLEKYPSIKVVLDVHRDAVVKNDGTKLKLLADIGGVPAAQCMFVVGTNAQLTHNNWQDNMRLAVKLQGYANQKYPGLMRAINVRKERFNQQSSSGSIIVEVGSNGNTLEEAKAGGKFMAETIAAVLLGKE